MPRLFRRAHFKTLMVMKYTSIAHGLKTYIWRLFYKVDYRAGMTFIFAVLKHKTATMTEGILNTTDFVGLIVLTAGI